MHRRSPQTSHLKLFRLAQSFLPCITGPRVLLKSKNRFDCPHIYSRRYLEAYSQAVLGPSVADAQAAEKASATAQIIDSYNSKKRAQSLVEKHQEAMLKEKQNKKKKKKEESKNKEEWEGSHPWKPWDREKDLVIGKTVKIDKDSSATALASRFGASRPEERRFL